MSSERWSGARESIDAALAAAHRGDYEGALAELLTLWSSALANPDGHLGDAIVRLGDTLGARAEAIEGNASVRQRAWMKRATAVAKKRPTPGDVSRLLAELTRSSIASAALRLEAVDAWAPDPRVDRLLVALLTEVPFPGASARRLWRAVFRRAERIRDPRAREALPEAVGAFQQKICLELRTFAKDLGAALLEDLHDVDESELSEPLRRALEPLGKRHASRENLEAQAAELLAAIHEAPQDDDARRVYGDLLEELGDPRGRFITLSFLALEAPLDKAQTREYKKLLKTHGRKWLGNLDRVITAWKLSYERGFLSGCRIRKVSAEVANKIAGDPLLTTVERFEGPAPIYLHPTMRALREVVADADGAQELLGGETERPNIDTLIYVGPRAEDSYALRRLAVADWPDYELDESEIALLRECRGLPGLRHLAFRNADLQPWVPGSGVSPERWGWLFDAPVLERLETLRVPSMSAALGPWLETLATAPLSARVGFELDLSLVDRCCIHREAGVPPQEGRVELAVEVGRGEEGFTHQMLNEALASISPSSRAFGALQLRWSGHPPTERQRQNLEAATEGIGSRASFEVVES